MRIGILIFPQVTEMDFVGPLDVLARIRSMAVDPETSVRLIGTEKEVVCGGGMVVAPPEVRPDLSAFDLLVVAGGQGTRPLMKDGAFLDYLRTYGMDRPIASVCTGALLLGAAGYLRDKRATTHHGAFNLLKPFCREVVAERIVEDGNVVTAGGVTSGIDLALYLVGKRYGAGARRRIADQMEYPDALAG